jgi:hypothetical protein
MTLPTLMQIRQSLTNFLRDDEGLRCVTEILRGSVLGKVIYLALGNTLVTFPPTKKPLDTNARGFFFTYASGKYLFSLLSYRHAFPSGSRSRLQSANSSGDFRAAALFTGAPSLKPSRFPNSAWVRLSWCSEL